MSEEDIGENPNKEDNEETEEVPAWKEIFQKLGEFLRSNTAKNIARLSSLLGLWILAIINLVSAFAQDLAIGLPFDWRKFTASFVFASTLFLGFIVKIVFGNQAQKEVATLVEQNKQLQNDLYNAHNTIRWTRAVAEYRAELAARDNKVPEAFEATYVWGITNETLNNPEELPPLPPKDSS
jgi:hypothetical protein